MFAVKAARFVPLFPWVCPRMTSIQASYRYTEAVALRANQAITRALFPWYRFLPAIGAIMTLGLAFEWFFKHVAPWDGINPLLMGPFFCLLPFYTKRHLRRQFRGNPNANLEVTWDISAERLINSTRGSHSAFEWSKLVRISEARDGFLLFPQARLAFWIPKAAFLSDEEVEEFRRLVRDNRLAR
jgi:hypothetical protein